MNRLRLLPTLTLTFVLAGFGFGLPYRRANGCGASFAETPGSPVSVGDAPNASVAADFNRDGNPDLAVANRFSANVTILLGNGSGGFLQATGSPVSVRSNPISMAAGDFNLDETPDLAVANLLSNNVTILLGNGSGGFTQPADSPVGVGTFPISVAAGDFNLDDTPDLAVANNGSDNVTILLGTGSGGFTPAAGSPVGAGIRPASVAVGDFNLDDTPDLAVGNVISGNVTILLGNGSGGFTPAAGSPVNAGDGLSAVAVGDFNVDGKSDLTIANTGSNNVTILLGNGMGGFTQAAGSPVGAGDFPESVAVADFNLDGKPDLVTANNGAHNVTILLGDGGGGFIQPAGSPVGAGASPAFVTAGDLNLDGKPDLAVSNFVSDGVTILLNTCIPNTPPMLTAGEIIREQGSPAANARLAIASDAEDAANILRMEISSDGVNFSNLATHNGVTVTLTDGNVGATGNNPDAMGQVFGDVALSCGATSASFTLKALDRGGLMATAHFSVNVMAQPFNPLPAGAAGVFYSQSVGSGAASGASYTLVRGSLPPGFTLNPTTGVLSGTATVSNTYNFTIQVNGAGGCFSSSRAYDLVITCPAITINPANLANATVGTPYSQTLSATPAGGGYGYVAGSGLPGWASLNSATGVISGTPAANGIFNFTITATGFGSCSASNTYSISVTGGGGGCAAIALPAVSGGRVGQFYYQSVAAWPAGVYSYELSGERPPGVTLYPGFLQGFPTGAGTYNFTITATGGGCTVSRAYTVTFTN